MMKRISLFLVFMLLSVCSLANHWEPDTHQFPDNMNLIGVIEINGIEQTTEAFELGAFCGTECRGSEMLAYYEGLNRYMVFMTLYGQTGNELTFRIYDHVLHQELEVDSQVAVQFVPNAILGAIHDPFVVAFTGGQCLITAHAIPVEGGAIMGSGGYWIGETCTLQATANEGYSFVEWTENGQQVAVEPTLSILVTMNHDLEAHFSVNSFEITLEAQPNDGGTVSGNGNYSFGTTVTVSAVPDMHYEFINWTEDGVMISGSSEYTFEVNGDRHLVATFSQEHYAVTAAVDPEDGGFVEGTGNYVYGQTATLVAQANENYEFVEWTEEGDFVSNQPSINFVVTQNRNLKAHFTYYDGVEETGTTLSVFPNPTAGIVTITSMDEECVIHLMDKNGHLILTKKCEHMSTDLDIGSIQDGCYALYVISERERYVRKLIKSSK